MAYRTAFLALLALCIGIGIGALTKYELGFQLAAASASFH
jgi:hypothetical protein